MRKIIFVLAIAGLMLVTFTKVSFANTQPAPRSIECKFSGVIKKFIDSYGSNSGRWSWESKYQEIVFHIDKAENIYIPSFFNFSCSSYNNQDANGTLTYIKEIEEGFNSPIVITRYPESGLEDGTNVEGMKLFGSFRYNPGTESVGLYDLSFEKINSDVKDPLVEGQTYTVKELNTNTSAKARKFFTEAYVKYIYKRPLCPPTGTCKLSMEPNIIISENKDRKVDYSNMSERDAILYVGYDKPYAFEINRRYQFEVSVTNKSNTNISTNKFTLVSVKNINGSAVATTTATLPQVTDNQATKQSFFQKLWGWFAGLFR